MVPHRGKAAGATAATVAVPSPAVVTAAVLLAANRMVAIPLPARLLVLYGGFLSAALGAAAGGMAAFRRTAARVGAGLAGFLLGPVAYFLAPVVASRLWAAAGLE